MKTTNFPQSAEVRVFEDGIGTVRRAVDQVIGHRQKKKGMTVRRAAWSVKGSKALAVLRVVELNGLWQSLWFPEEMDARAAA